MDYGQHQRCRYCSKWQQSYRNSVPCAFYFNICVRSGIFLEMKWIPRNLNYRADLLSRTIDLDHFTINDTYFSCWIVNGGLTQSIGLLVVITPSFQVTILYFTSLAPKSWTLLLKTGNAKILDSSIGLAN